MWPEREIDLAGFWKIERQQEEGVKRMSKIM